MSLLCASVCVMSPPCELKRLHLLEKCQSSSRWRSRQRIKKFEIEVKRKKMVVKQDLTEPGNKDKN